MTLEKQIDELSATVTGMGERTRHPDEWVKLNNLHLMVCELKGQLEELREMEKRNLNLRKE